EEPREYKTGDRQTQKKRNPKEIVKNAMTRALHGNPGRAGRVAIEWVSHKDAGPNQADPNQSHETRSPNRAGRPKGTSQSNGEHENEQTCKDETDNLHPAALSDGKRADGML